MTGYLAVITAALIAGAGVYGAISRRNFAFVVISIELIFNAAVLLLVATGNASETVVAAIVFLAVSAAEVAVGFAIAVALARAFGASDTLKMTDTGGER